MRREPAAAGRPPEPSAAAEGRRSSERSTSVAPRRSPTPYLTPAWPMSTMGASTIVLASSTQRMPSCHDMPRSTSPPARNQEDTDTTRPTHSAAMSQAEKVRCAGGTGDRSGLCSSGEGASGARASMPSCSQPAPPPAAAAETGMAVWRARWWRRDVPAGCTAVRSLYWRGHTPPAGRASAAAWRRLCRGTGWACAAGSRKLALIAVQPATLGQCC